MPQINYDISILPNPPDITLEMGITEKKLCIKEKSYGMTVGITPSAEAIVNGELTPTLFGDFLTAGAQIFNAIDGAKLITSIGTKIATAVNTEIGKQLKDKQINFDIGDSLTHTFQIGDVPVTLSAANLELTGDNGRLLLCGTLVLT